MIQIERHIEILLLDNDCVIVPDFGGFMAHHVDARYEEEEGLFLPPLRTLGFNPQLRLNDSLLAQSYIEAYDISYPEALRRIASEVDELKQHLSNEGSYELNDLGTIYVNDEGRYEFSPCESGILTPSLYGLSSFEMPIVNAKTMPAMPSLTPIGAQTVEPIVELDEETPVAEQSEAEEEEVNTSYARTISIKVSVLRNIAAACIAVVAFLLFPKQLATSDSQSAYNGGINTELLQRIMPRNITIDPSTTETAAPSQPSASSSALTEVKATTDVKAQEASPETPAAAEVEKPQHYYAIVLASQVSKKNANSFVDQLHKKGFSEARVLEAGKNTRVLYGRYSSENEAYNALRPLRKQSSDFAEGWVMKF